METENRTLSGREIELQYKNEELEYMYIPANAHVVSLTSGWLESDTTEKSLIESKMHFEDVITGKVLKGFFINGELDSMRMEGMATTLYNIFEDSVYQGNNAASGDTMIIHFQDKSLQKIDIFGGGRGTFSPDSMNKQVLAPIHYKSKTIEYNIPEEQTNLYANAEIQYTDMNLTAGVLNIDWNSSILNAYPLVIDDSLLIDDSPMLPFKITVISTQHGVRQIRLTRNKS